MASLERRVAIDAARAAGHLLKTEAGIAPHRYKGSPTNLVTEMDARAEELIVVSIGLEIGKRVELGLVFDPNLDELFVAERRHGATVNDRPLTVSTTESLDESLLATGFPYNIRDTSEA